MDQHSSLNKPLASALRRISLAACLAWPLLTASAAYRLETVNLPAAMSPEVSAVAFSPEGELFVANRSGDLWKADRNARNWRLWASGLHEPLGLLVESSSVAYVVHRPELVRLEDSNGDGTADTFTTINDSWGLTGNYHEFAYGLVRDKEGNFFGGLGLDSGGERELQYVKLTRGPFTTDKVRGESQWSLVPYRGWSFKITPQGEFIPWSVGFRQPAGIGMSPEGEFFSSDNQGDWVASSGLIHHKQGEFYGHPASLKWAPEDFSQGLSDEELARHRTPPAVILPHGDLGGSPGEPIWDVTGGKFGPFDGQVFVGDFSRLISRVFLEKVAGEYQGASFPFVRDPELRQGNMRMAFSPDGHLYVGQTSRGWGVGEGLQRIVWDGTDPVEVHSISLQNDGFSFRFTAPLTETSAGRPENYHVKRFRYLYHGRYGSPRIDVVPVPVTSVRVTEGGRRADVSLAEVLPGFIYEFQLEHLTATSGELLTNPTAFYTVNRLHNGAEFAGPFTRPMMTAEEAASVATIDLEAGKRVYNTYCLACHQEDGRGGGAAAADFVGDRRRLSKSDAELLRSIRLGTDGGMPGFGSVLTDGDIRNALAYIRESFDAQQRRGTR